MLHLEELVVEGTFLNHGLEAFLNLLLLGFRYVTTSKIHAQIHGIVSSWYHLSLDDLRRVVHLDKYLWQTIKTDILTNKQISQLFCRLEARDSLKATVLVVLFILYIEQDGSVFVTATHIAIVQFPVCGVIPEL